MHADPGPTASVFVEGDELFDAMLRDMRGAAESVRLDYRSFFLNDELNVIDECGELNSRLADAFLDDLQAAEEVLERPWSQRGWPRRIGETIGWMARHWL